MKVLRANVRRTAGRARETGAGVDPEKQPPVAFVRIGPDEQGAFMLLRFAADGKEITDTWHMTVADAKREALLEYAIAEADWEEEAGG